MSDTEQQNTHPSEEQQTRWLPIITDMLILIAVMSVIGYLCNLIMKPFEKNYPTDSLVALILKANVKNGADDVFAKELSEGVAADAGFVNTGDLTGRTPLMWAAYTHFNDPDKALEKDAARLFYVNALLHTPGIEPQKVDNDGFTALHWAAWSGLPQCSAALIDVGGLDINAADNSGYTPLMLAALRGNVEVVRLLLEKGADLSLKNRHGQTAADLATNFESAYSSRDSWVYKLIYNRNRESFYKATLALLTGAPAVSADAVPTAGQDAEKNAVGRKELEVEEGATEPTTINPTQDTPATAE